MRASRGMGAIMPSKMGKKKTIVRKDNPNDVEVYKKGGAVKNWIQEAVGKPGALRESLGVKKANAAVAAGFLYRKEKFDLQVEQMNRDVLDLYQN